MSKIHLRTHGTSNSEVMTWASCRRKWVFQYHPGYRLQRPAPTSFRRGTAVHEVLQTFFTQFKKSYRYDDSVEAAMQKWSELVMSFMKAQEAEMCKVVSELQMPLQWYFENERRKIETWEILAVEETFRMPIRFGLEAVGQLDLVLKHHSGPNKGQTVPLDHKTCYNFWSDSELEINSQGPLYAMILKYNFPEAVIRQVYFNQVRYRLDIKEQEARSKIHAWPLDRKYSANILDNHEKLSAEIADFYDMPREDAIERTTMAVNPYVCKTCTMRKLCRAVTNGEDTTNIEKYDYEPNSYGYDKNLES